MESSKVTGGLLSKVATLLSATLVVSTYGAYMGSAITSGWAILGLFALVLAGIFVVYGLNRVSVALGITSLVGWSFVLGLMIGPAMNKYVHDLGFETVELVFLGSAGVMVVLGFIGATMKRDLAALGPVLFLALFGLIIAQFIAMLLPHINGLHIVLGGFGAILFAGYFLYDFQQAARDEDTWTAAVGHTMSILLDFWNFVLSILQMIDDK